MYTHRPMNNIESRQVGGSVFGPKDANNLSNGVGQRVNGGGTRNPRLQNSGDGRSQNVGIQKTAMESRQATHDNSQMVKINVRGRWIPTDSGVFEAHPLSKSFLDRYTSKGSQVRLQQRRLSDKDILSNEFNSADTRYMSEDGKSGLAFFNNTFKVLVKTQEGKYKKFYLDQLRFKKGPKFSEITAVFSKKFPHIETPITFDRIKFAKQLRFGSKEIKNHLEDKTNIKDVLYEK